MKARTAAIVDTVLVLCAVCVTAVTVMGRPRSTAKAAELRVTDWRPLQVSNMRIGTADAPFALVVWTDYECPACAREELEFEQVKARLGDSLTIAYHHFPVAEIHGSAMYLATLAECSAAQGQFAPVHHQLFAQHLARDSTPLATLAALLPSVDTIALQECARDQTTIARIRAEIEAARTLGVRGTPTLLIGDKLQLGGLTATELETALRDLD